MNKKHWKYFFLVPEESANYKVKMVMSFLNFVIARGAKYREYGDICYCGVSLYIRFLRSVRTNATRKWRGAVPESDTRQQWSQLPYPSSS